MSIKSRIYARYILCLIQNQSSMSLVSYQRMQSCFVTCNVYKMSKCQTKTQKLQKTYKQNLQKITKTL